MLTEGFQIPFGVQIVNPLPVDTWSGPYTGLTEALNSIPIEIRYPTMEVRMLSENGNKIYWFKDGIEDIDLVPFATTVINVSSNGIISLDDSITIVEGAENFNIEISQDIQNSITGETFNRITGYTALNEGISNLTNRLSEHTGDTSVHLTGPQNELLDGITGITSVEINYLSGVTSNIQEQFNNEAIKKYKEIISENINGINTAFDLSKVFISGTVSVYLNGIREYYASEDGSSQIIFQDPPQIRGFTDLIEVEYFSYH